MYSTWKSEKSDLLGTITVITLNQHDLLSNDLTLVDGAEPKNITQSRVSLLVSVSNTHTTTSSNVETSKFALLIDNSDKANIVREEIDVIMWRDGNCDFELESKPVSNGNQTE